MRRNIEVNEDKIKQEIFRRIFYVINLDKKNINTNFFEHTAQSENETVLLLIKRYYACYKILDFIGDEDSKLLQKCYRKKLILLLTEIKSPDDDIQDIKDAFEEFDQDPIDDEKEESGSDEGAKLMREIEARFKGLI
jgi:hypothetical protein